MGVMMSTHKHTKKLLAGAITTALFTHSAIAAEFYFGEDDDISLQITSQLSIGSSWRIQDADSRYISRTNGGTGNTATTDDGNLNFEKNDVFSQIIKGSHDFNLSKGDFGALVRVKYWHDFELSDGARPHGNSGNGYTPGEPLSDEGFTEFGQFSGIEIMDAYLYGVFDIGDVPIDIRLGRQVVSWGESTFIQGGLNSTNPFDVNALRRPGASLKEGLLPVGMFFVNAGVTENLSIKPSINMSGKKPRLMGVVLSSLVLILQQMVVILSLLERIMIELLWQQVLLLNARQISNLTMVANTVWLSDILHLS